MIKRIMCLFFVFLLAGSLTVQSTASQLSDYQRKLDDTESKKTNLAKDIKKTEKDLNWNKKKRDEVVKKLEELGLHKEKVEQQVALLESAIMSLDDAIAQAEQEYADQMELLKARLSVMYKKSSAMWELDELLKSKSVNEFFIRLRLMQQIAENDQSLLDSVEAKRLEIEDLKAQKQYELDNAVQQVKQYIQKIEEKEVSRSSLDKEIKADQKSLKQYEAEEEELKKRSDELEELIKQAQKSSGKYRGGNLIWPMPTATHVTSEYGNRLHPVYKVWKMHTGIDIGSYMNEAIVASGNGTVIYTGKKGGYGNTIIVDHGGGITTLYAHINSRGTLVKVGQEVKAGQQIAKAGRTGTATGPHLHFEVRVDGEHTDPLERVKP
ncbi:MAG: peptidoglycan DD-metalloendopeptidase family protein [Thermoclostridium sp.]|nr:peptidoglycan DD-metalloendopeptidase family protein [Thermoclostridium sp.]